MPWSRNRSRARSLLGKHGAFTVICVKEQKGDFTRWGEVDGLTGSSVLKKNGIGSMHQLAMRRGDVIKVSCACSPDGSRRWPVPRTARRLESGFLDTKFPIHNPSDEQTWWVGTIVHNGKDIATGRFPQNSVTLVGNKSEKDKVFRCKLCARIQKEYTTSTILNKFGILGEKDHIFGVRSLCSTCGPKILQVVKSVATTVVSNVQSNENAIMKTLRSAAEQQLEISTEEKIYTLTPKRTDMTDSSVQAELGREVYPEMKTTRDICAQTNLGELVASRPSSAKPPAISPQTKARKLNERFGSSIETEAESNIKREISDTKPQNLQLLKEIMEYCEGRDFQSIFEKFIMNHVKYYTDVRFDKYGNPEHQFLWHDIFEEYLRFFVTAMENAITDKGETIEAFYKQCELVKSSGDFMYSNFLKLLLDSADYSEFTGIMIRMSSQVSMGLSPFSEPADKCCTCMVCMNFNEDRLNIIKKNLAQIFEDSTTYEGHMNSQDLLAMVTRLQKEFPSVLIPNVTSSMAEALIASLDKDGNGTIEYEEFVDWVMQGSQKTPQERAKLTKSGDIFNKLIGLFDSLVAVATKMHNSPKKNLSASLESIFQDATDETEGHMKAKHLMRMVKRLKREHPDVPVAFQCSQKTAKWIIDTLDEDKNGSIEQKEFVQWMLKGAKESREERRKQANSDKKSRLIIQFQEVLLRYARKIQVKKKMESLRPALLRIFYEATETNQEVNALSAENLIQMASRLRQKYPDLSWMSLEGNDKHRAADSILRALDGDKNGRIEVDEWVPRILSEMAKTEVERREFALNSNDSALLVKFVETIRKVAQIMTAEVIHLKSALERIFVQNAEHGKHMRAENICTMTKTMKEKYPNIKHVASLQMSTEDAEFIIQSLDEDGNKSIEVNEWTDWLLLGFSKSRVQRTAFAQRGDKFAMLRNFLDAIESIAQKQSIFGEGIFQNISGQDEPEFEAEETKNSVEKSINITDPRKIIREQVKREGVLKQIPALHCLGDEHLEAVVDAMEYKIYDEDDSLIIEEGTKADRLYVIVSGVVAIMATSKEGWPIERERKGKFEAFGEECLLGIENHRYSISCVATGDDQVQVLELNVKANDIISKNSDDVIAAAKADRTKKVEAKFSKKLRSNFLEARKRRRASKKKPSGVAKDMTVANEPPEGGE